VQESPEKGIKPSGEKIVMPGPFGTMIRTEFREYVDFNKLQQMT
jgi:hypothetical protein